MNWPSRLKVAVGAARGLAYLHSSSAIGIPIVHRDFKSTNVLLSLNFEAKMSDFGLAKLMPEGQENYVITRVMGTTEALFLLAGWDCTAISSVKVGTTSKCAMAHVVLSYATLGCSCSAVVAALPPA